MNQQTNANTGWPLPKQQVFFRNPWFWGTILATGVAVALIFKINASETQQSKSSITLTELEASVVARLQSPDPEVRKIARQFIHQSPAIGKRIVFWALDPANAEAEKKIRTLAMKEEQARREKCKENLRQISLALHHYHDTHSALPLSVKNDVDSWLTQMLPFLQQSTQYEESFTDLKQGELSQEKKKDEVSQTKIPVFYAPDREVAEEQDGADPSTK